MSDGQPEWFSAALAQTATEHHVEVNDCSIAYRTWGQVDNPGLILIHGFNAHSHWWDFIAPALCGDFHVMALDCSGAGDSGHRDSYDLDTFADEVMAVAEDAGHRDDLTVVGHSFGGGIALKTTARYSANVRALISVDAKIIPMPDDVLGRSTSGFLPNHLYPDAAAAIEDFRVIPPQRCPNQYIINHIAKQSIKETAEGWVLKADPRLLDAFRFEDQTDALLNLNTGFGMIYGSMSALITPEVIEYLQYVAPPGSPFTAIPGAAHHLFLDAPLPFIDELKTMLQQWS